MMQDLDFFFSRVLDEKVKKERKGGMRRAVGHLSSPLGSSGLTDI